jgi:hypothetical protein
MHPSIAILTKGMPRAAILPFAFMALLVRCDNPAPQPAKTPLPSWPIATDRFSLATEGKGFFLIPAEATPAQRLPIPREWLITPKEEKEEVEGPVPTAKFDSHVTSFPIGNGSIGLHLSSYDIMSEGSMQGAAGRDVFLIYNPGTHAVTKGLTGLGITKDRYRSFGCFTAHMTHFLIADVDRDGRVDIGAVKEEIHCLGPDETAQPPVYEQQRILWYLYTPSGWTPEPDLAESLPSHYTELPLIGMDLSPVDFVGQLTWNSPNPKDWATPPQYEPAYRRTLIESKPVDNRNPGK